MQLNLRNFWLCFQSLFFSFALSANVGPDQVNILQGPPAPTYGYHDITIGALQWLAPHIQINPHVSTIKL